MGRQHLNEMKLAGMTPVAVVELDPKRLEVARADFPGIETYATVDEMLAGSMVELVTVITPHNTHAELALKSPPPVATWSWKSPWPSPPASAMR